MARRRKKTQKDNRPSAPAWMVTYSDMVTLLLAFFVLMLSMAELDKIKFRQAVGSLKGAFGVMKSEPVNESQTDMVLPSVGVIPYDMVQRLYNQILMKIKKLDLNRNIEVVTDRGAIVLRVKEKILFAPGSTSLKKGGESVLQKVAALVSPLPFDMRIEGHTDNTPYKVKGLTNWDLSVQRAITVLKYYVGSKQLSLDRLSAVGYGDTRPLVPNNSPENRALNRRVEFVLEAGGDYRQTLPYLIDSSEQLPF